MFADSPEIVIQGVTESGQRFRPSDWAERLCRMMSVFGADRHLNYLPYLKPVIAAGMRCVVTLSSYTVDEDMHEALLVVSDLSALFT